MQICCYSKCGLILQEFNPHLPFGDHLLRIFFFCFFTWTKRFSTFFVVYIVDEGVQNNGFIFNSKLEGLCWKTSMV
jgi:hypothetical protein